jgi:hypothetical protein
LIASDFTPKEIRALRALSTPTKIQRFVEEMPYHHAKTAWSPRIVLQERTAHCLEGAIFAAAALRANGFPPLLFDLEGYRDDDHVLAIFQMKRHWGAIGKSNFSGLRYREPVYRSLRELAMSYFDDYFNMAGDRSLRAFATRPVNLARFDSRKWMTADKSQTLWYIADHLCRIPHTNILKPGMDKNLSRVDKRRLAAGFVGRQEPGKSNV